MSDPQRLIDDGGDEISRSLLRSARDDAPSPHARQKTMVALGLAGGLSATVTAATATSTASTLAKSGATVALFKWIGVGVLGGVVTVGAVTFAPRFTMGPQAAPNPGPAKPALVQTPEPSSLSRSAPPPAEEPAPSAAPATEEAPTAKPVEAPKPSAKPAEKSTLSAEVEAIDAARVALNRGDTSGALHALDEYDRRFRGGALGQEATVLRIMALSQRGDRAAAARLARAFLDAHPTSPLAPRMRALVTMGPQAAPNPGPAEPAPAGEDAAPAP